jgi:hypothetical protein
MNSNSVKHLYTNLKMDYDTEKERNQLQIFESRVLSIQKPLMLLFISNERHPCSYHKEKEQR